MIKKNKLLHIVSSLDPAAGGVSQALRTMIKGLASVGITSEAATIDDPAASYIKEDNFVIHAFGSGKTAWQYAPQLLVWLQENLIKYDVIIVHALWQYHTYATYKVWKKIKGKKAKLFVMPHGMLDPYFQKAKGRKLKAIRNWFFWKLTEKNIINNSDGLLFTCETEKILAGQSFSPYHPKSLNVVGLGVEAPPSYHDDMKKAFEQKIGKALDKYWLYISRIHEKKGTDLLIDAYVKLKKEMLDIPPLIIAGPGLETPFGAQIKKLASVDKDIYFPGMLSGNAKWGAFWGCEVFILPSHQENFGIAVVEALACGKTVLISDQVNIWREIQKAGAGLVENDTSQGVFNLMKNWQLLLQEDKNKKSNATINAFNKYFSEKTATANLVAVLSQHNFDA